MSREQVPRTAGMRPAANAAQPPLRVGNELMMIEKEAA